MLIGVLNMAKYILPQPTRMENVLPNREYLTNYNIEREVISGKKILQMIEK